MFTLIFIFGLIFWSAIGDDTSQTKLSRYAELNKPSNQTNQTIKESFGEPTIDSLKTEQNTQAGKEPLLGSLTNFPYPPSVEQPVKQMKIPGKTEDLAMSLNNSVQRKEVSNKNKLEKIVEVETAYPKEKREVTIPKNNLKLSILDEWIENKVKVSHISHIYIGESLYPYMYEESRVFQSEPPKPSSDENSHVKEAKISETRHKKEDEVPVYEITKIYEIK